MAFIKTKLSTIRPDDLYDTLRLTYGFNDEEQQKKPGILAKPAEPVSDSDVVAAGFFDYVFTKSRERAAKVRAEAMEQYARDSAEEAAKIRSILGITRSKAPTGQLSDMARDSMFSSSDMRGTDLTMKDNAREAQDVFQPMITPVSRGEQPEMADSPEPVDAPSIDTRSNEMLDKAIKDVLETVVDSDASDSTDSADGGAAPSGGKGIMSFPDSKSSYIANVSKYGEAVFEISSDLKKTEGVKPHIGADWENVTLSLGIVPTSGLKIDGMAVPSDRSKRGKWLKKNGYVDKQGKQTQKFNAANIDTSGATKNGIKRSDYSSDTEWSIAVINGFKKGAEEKVEGFNELGVKEQKTIIDLAWNMGVGGLDYTGNQSLIGELSKAPEDRDVSTMLEAGKHVTEGNKVMRGLARRKALAINELIDDPTEKIIKIRQLSIGPKTYHTYINDMGEEVKTIQLGPRHKGSPDGIIDVATGEEVVPQEELDYSSIIPRPKARPDTRVASN